ncbi:hypothetical protein [Alsobacter sp. R-9]
MQTLPDDLVDAVVTHFVTRNDAQSSSTLQVDVGETVDALAVVAARFIAALPPEARPDLTKRFLRSFEETLIAELIAAIEREAQQAAKN